MLNEYRVPVPVVIPLKNSDTPSDIENMYDIRCGIFIPNYKVISELCVGCISICSLAHILLYISYIGTYYLHIKTVNISSVTYYCVLSAPMNKTLT